LTGTLLILSLFIAQAPGDGWAMARARPREVKSVYWELFQTTEVSLLLIPEVLDQEKPLVQLVFQAFCRGRRIETAPERLVIRALPLPLTGMKEPSLRLDVDGKRTISSGSQTKPRLLYPPFGDQANGVEVGIEPEVLGALVLGKQIEGEALGFPIRLAKEDQDALGRFVAALVREIQKRPR
jgi:hypothetical protein